MDADEAVACASDRATFFATGSLSGDRTITVDVPIPVAIGGKARPHSLSATLAWFTPVTPGRKSYRNCRLKLIQPDEIVSLAVKAHARQPDHNQTNRGTVYSRCWSGNQAPVVRAGMTIPIVIQRDPDQGTTIDESVVFGLAVTVAMPGEVAIYDEIRTRLRPRSSISADT